MCKFNGITEPMIQEWDLHIEELVKQGKVDEDADPGYVVVDGKISPYRDQHHLATAIEAMLLPFLNGYTEQEYNEEIETLWATRLDKPEITIAGGEGEDNE
jgi:hypothetical protein